jgi:hypothetical protein
MSTSNRKALDKRLKKKLMKTYTVVMFDLVLDEIEKKYGAQAGLKLKFDALDSVIRP